MQPKSILAIAVLVIEIAYCTLCVSALYTVYKKFNNLNSNEKTLASITSVFLCSCIVGAFSGIFQLSIWIKLIFMLVNQAELIFIATLMHSVLTSRQIKSFFNAILVILFFASFKVAFVRTDTILSSLYFCILTLTSISIAFVYFKELAESPPRSLLKSDMNSNMVFGLFFGNSLFLIISVCALSLNILKGDNDTFLKPKGAFTLPTLFFFFQYIMSRFCYLPLFYSIRRAYK